MFTTLGNESVLPMTALRFIYPSFSPTFNAFYVNIESYR